MGFLGNVGKSLGRARKSITNVVSDPAGSLGDLWGDVSGANAADRATREQQKATQQAMAAQESALNRQLDMLQPFYERAGTAMDQMGTLSGLGGAEAQQAAIAQLQNMPGFQEQIAAQENALLQNASATGGLRGGNMQAALAQFRPQMLQSAIQQQMANLGGIAGMGMNPLSQASGAIGATGANQANLFANMGAAQGANTLAGYQLGRSLLTDIAGLGVKAYGAGMF